MSGRCPRRGDDDGKDDGRQFLPAPRPATANDASGRRRQHRNITLANPAVEPSEVAYTRWPFTERLTETLAGFDASEGAPVLGLFGKWG